MIGTRTNRDPSLNCVCVFFVENLISTASRHFDFRESM